jgi:hypothetical protein
MFEGTDDRVAAEYFAQLLGTDSLTITWRLLAENSPLHSAIYRPDEQGRYIRAHDTEGLITYLDHNNFQALVELTRTGIFYNGDASTIILVSRIDHPPVNNVKNSEPLSEGVSLSPDKKRVFISCTDSFSKDDLQKIINAMS